MLICFIRRVSNCALRCHGGVNVSDALDLGLGMLLECTAVKDFEALRDQIVVQEKDSLGEVVFGGWMVQTWIFSHE